MIRIAKTEDIPEITSFLRLCVEDQGILDIGYIYDPNSVEELFQYLINVEGFVSLKIDDSLKILGCIACKVGPTTMNNNQMIAYEMAWNVHPELSNYRKMKILWLLLDEAIVWSNIRELFLYMGTHKNNKALDKLLLKKGFAQRETLFLLNKEI